MKKLTVFLLCFLMVCSSFLTVFASNDAVINVTVPSSHKVSFAGENFTVYYENESGKSFDVPRLSSPRFYISVSSNVRIESVFVDGVNVTDSVKNGYLELAPVYAEKIVMVTTKNIVSPIIFPSGNKPTKPEETTTVNSTTGEPTIVEPTTTESTTTEPTIEPTTEPTTEGTTIVTPSISYVLSVEADDASVFFEGVNVELFGVAEASKPRILIRAESGKIIESVTVDGVDVTHLIKGGYLELDSVYKDQVIVVNTKDEPVSEGPTYKVTGTVTLNGKPLANVNLELRSTLKTTTTDENGYFSFEDVEYGKHSLTAVSGEKVIGFMSFEMNNESTNDVTIMDDGTYSVSIDKDGAGIELSLVLNKESGTISPANVGTVGPDEFFSLWWLWLILAILAIAVIMVVTLKIKKRRIRA